MCWLGHIVIWRCGKSGRGAFKRKGDGVEEGSCPWEKSEIFLKLNVIYLPPHISVTWLRANGQLDCKKCTSAATPTWQSPMQLGLGVEWSCVWYVLSGFVWASDGGGDPQAERAVYLWVKLQILWRFKTKCRPAGLLSPPSPFFIGVNIVGHCVGIPIRSK